ncbi:MAG: TonB-dependent receptor [Holophagales bacterium]|nr:TonB-dependent receptor [Holophagales bacterium]
MSPISRQRNHPVTPCHGRSLVWLFALVTLASAFPAQASSSGATLKGTVTDPSGVGVDGVEVSATAVDAQVRRSARTRDGGRYEITGLSPGSYVLTFSRPGFAPQASSHLTLAAGATSTHDVRLELSQIADQVTVTGRTSRLVTKVETPILLLPQAVSLVPEWLLEEQQATHLTEAIRNVSGAVMSTTWRGSYDNYSLRGFIANQSTNLRRNGVGISKFGQLLDANAERVEVLKGPSSVLYGTLDPGGIINVVTKRPQARNMLGVDLRGGSYDQLEGRLDVTGPFSDRFFYRINAAAEDRDSYRDLVSYESVFFSGALQYLMGDSTKWDVELELKDEEGTSDPGSASDTGDFGAFDRLPIDTFFGEEDAVFRRRREALFSHFDHQISSRWLMRGVLNIARYDRHPTDVVLRNLASDGRTLARRADVRQQDLDWTYGELELSGDFASGAVEHRFSFGVNIDSSRRDERFSRTNIDPIDIFEPVQSGLPAEIPLLRETELDIETFGFFLQDQIALGDRVTVLLGLRYTTFDQTNNNLTTAVRQDFTADELTPQLGLVYQHEPWISFYASYSESFAPTLRLDDNGNSFDPSFGEQIEAGVKAELFSGRLSATLALFQLDRANVLSFVPDATGALVPFQGGLWRSEGLELDLNGRLAPSWSVSFSYAYLDARVVEDGVFDVGRRLGGAPEHSGSLWLSYELENGLGLGGGLFHQGETRPFTSSGFFLPSFTTADAMVSYRLSDQLRLQLNVKNIFDERYYTAGSSVSAYPAAPTTAQLLLSFQR